MDLLTRVAHPERWTRGRLRYYAPERSMELPSVRRPRCGDGSQLPVWAQVKYKRDRCTPPEETNAGPYWSFSGVSHPQATEAGAVSVYVPPRQSLPRSTPTRIQGSHRVRCTTPGNNQRF